MSTDDILDELDPEAAPTWTLRTLSQAYQDREPTRYIVDRFFATHTLNIVYGAPASMKSMLLADMCAHVANGTNWLPGGGEEAAGVIVDPSPVLWLDMDNGTRRTDERFGAIGRAHKMPEDAPVYYVSMPQPPLFAHDAESMGILKNAIVDNGVTLAVIDNLGLITGEIEENSAQMAVIMGNLRYVAEETGAALVLVHHQRKGGAQGARAGDALRGHSSIEAAIDLALHVVRDADTSDITIRSTKTRGVDVPVIGARFNYTHIPDTSDLHTAWFDGIKPRRGENAIKEAIIEIVEERGEVGKTKLVELVRDDLQPEAPGVNKIRAWVDDLIAVSGELTERQKGNYRLISLA